MKRALGYTFVELLVVLAIVSLVSAYGLLAWWSYRQSQRGELLAYHLRHAIQTARAQAFLRHQTVVLSPLKEWTLGAVLTAQGDIIAQWQWDAKPFHVTWVGFKKNQTPEWTWDLSSAASNGHFSIFLKGVEVKRLNINRIGRVL